MDMEGIKLKTLRTAEIMDENERSKVPAYMQEFINYRKSGLSLNHIIGCSLNCGYCVRHFWGNWDMKTPQMLCSDDEAIEALLTHKFFIKHKTPIQLFNKATDPFLPTVKNHTHYILKTLDNLGLTNMVLIITRAHVSKEDMEILESLKHIKVTLFFTYSGIKNEIIEPISKTEITVNSIKTASENRKRTRIILYWRPLVPGWNDEVDTMTKVLHIGELTDAIVFTGYYHKEENARYFQEKNIEVPYTEFQRRKILPIDLENKVIELHKTLKIKTPLFRKTSCGATYAHGIEDYNGHWGVKELCDICPMEQQKRCKSTHRTPSQLQIEQILAELNCEPNYLIEDEHVWTDRLGEDRRYFIQHALNFQIWDIDWPHFKQLHGRSPTGYSLSESENKNYANVRTQFYKDSVQEDD